MNARAETIGFKPSFRDAWIQFQFCLVPMLGFYEPCYESGRAERMRIGVSGGGAFAVAGLYRVLGNANEEPSYSFTQLTINADDHPLMKRMHKPGDEKRGLIVLPSEKYGDWLRCDNVITARSFLTFFAGIQMDCTNLGMYKKTTPVSQGGLV